MKWLYKLAGYIVDFGDKLEFHALILERERAHQIAADCHGVFEPVYRRVEIPDEETERDET